MIFIIISTSPLLIHIHYPLWLFVTILHNNTLHVVHEIFSGDCFEITKQRKNFPEIVPFRLTRMMVAGMGHMGIAGPYRLTCERVMRVLRDNRESLVAMLEAFVYDPLISWLFLMIVLLSGFDVIGWSIIWLPGAVGTGFWGGEGKSNMAAA